MYKPKVPCYGCKHRTEDCHKSGHCEKYTEYVRLYEEYRKEQSNQYVVNEYKNDRALRKRK